MSLRSIGPLRFVIPLLFAMHLATQNVTAQDLSAQNHASLGISLAREGRLPAAEQELREAVYAAPAAAPYRAQLGSVLVPQEKWKEALQSFQKAIDLAPENLD